VQLGGAIRDPHHLTITTLVGQELKYIGRNDVDWILVHDAEERLEIEGHRPQRVGSRPATNSK
jgi:hypothetical protein